MIIIPPGQNFNTATPTIMRHEFAKLGIPADVIEALVLAAKHTKRRSPTSETFAQALVGATVHGIWGVKNMAAGPFMHPYIKNDYEVWKGIKAAKAKKLIKRWALVKVVFVERPKKYHKVYPEIMGADIFQVRQV